MELSARAVPVQQILPWRDLYRQEMNCQIVCDSLDSHEGWTQPYLLYAGDATAGYGSVALGGPWKNNPTLFQFYVLPEYRPVVFDLFAELLGATGATTIKAQTNDVLLSVMLHTFAHTIVSGSILFRDEMTTTHSPAGALFRRAEPNDSAAISWQELDSPPKWVVEIEGLAAAAGDILYHCNRPYGDIYMKVAEPFRRRGLGSFLVQELKKVCYAQRSIPGARCSPGNTASRRTLQKAGLVPCGHILDGFVRS